MKVTKLIREYVTDEVSKVYDAKVNPYSEQAKIDRETLTTFTEYLRTQQRESIKEFIADKALFEEGWKGLRPYEISLSVPSFYYVKTQAMIDEKKWNEENNHAKNVKIRDIILSLELGANRQELNDMLAELLKEA
jgi:hypothetical protein